MASRIDPQAPPPPPPFSVLSFGTTLIQYIPSQQQLQCSLGTFLSVWTGLDLRKAIPGNRLAPTQLGPYQVYIRVGNPPQRPSEFSSIARSAPPTLLTVYHYSSTFRLLTSQATQLSQSHISSISDMSQPSSSASSSFQGLFNAAFQDYENQTKTKLVQHPLAKKLEACDSVDSITAILQEQAQIFRGFRGDHGKIMKSLRSSVNVLYTLSNSTILGEVIGLVVSYIRHY